MDLHTITYLLFQNLELRIYRKQPLYLTQVRGKVHVHPILSDPHLWDHIGFVVVIVVFSKVTLNRLHLLHVQANEPSMVIPASIFIIYNLYGLSEYVRANEPIKAWLNNQRMWRVNAMTAWLFGILGATTKLLGISETAFEVTKKDQGNDGDDTNNSNIGRFTFDDSPIFVPGTAILLLNLSSLFIGMLDFKQGKDCEWGLGEVICIMWVLFIFWSFLKGLFAKGKYGIPATTILKSGALALLLVHLFKFYQ